MVSKNQIKFITSLQHKKYRIKHNFFIAEGVKVIQEFLDSNYVLEHLYETDFLFEQVSDSQKTLIKEDDMKRITAFSSASSCLAIFKIPNPTKITDNGLIVALDDIRDPGNVGAIIRLCDWFGISQIVCSQETVDVYNPKVIQATMGSISRVNINYIDLKDYVSKSKLPVYGTFMEGNNVYSEELPEEAIIILGNEANGISKELEKIIENKLSIPRFGSIQKTESLNVASAAAIFLSEFKRKS